MGVKLPFETFKSLIAIRNHVASVVLGSDYFIPLYSCFTGYLRSDSSLCSSFSQDLSEHDRACLDFVHSQGLLADFLDPATVSLLPAITKYNSVLGISANDIASVPDLTFLSYCNLTSMLGLRMIISLHDKTQCLTCHESENDCVCITYKFSYLQSLTCKCSERKFISFCNCNGIPAMIRDLDEFSKILDAISLWIVSPVVNFGKDGTIGNMDRMRPSFSHHTGSALQCRWRSSRKIDVDFGNSHREKWDFRPP